MMFFLNVWLITVTVLTVKMISEGNKSIFKKEIAHIKCIYIVFIIVYFLSMFYYLFTAFATTEYKKA